jgi:hypothetical protein
MLSYKQLKYSTKISLYLVYVFRSLGCFSGKVPNFMPLKSLKQLRHLKPRGVHVAAVVSILNADTYSIFVESSNQCLEG